MDYTDINSYYRIDQEQIDNVIIPNYKILKVDCISLVNCAMFEDEYFTKYRNKADVLNKMMHYYLNSKDSKIYQKTDYLCNEKEKVCICNLQADHFRKIYDRSNYDKNAKYISWVRRIGEHF